MQVWGLIAAGVFAIYVGTVLKEAHYIRRHGVRNVAYQRVMFNWLLMSFFFVSLGGTVVTGVAETMPVSQTKMVAQTKNKPVRSKRLLPVIRLVRRRTRLIRARKRHLVRQLQQHQQVAVSHKHLVPVLRLRQ
ncbi:hypothetical protein [Streptococcus sp. DD12]|uniref:hypothetical protein n=1 Tax=Streptococcus sp. DD12 TaxID=1777880 RepID=UPI000829A4C4|nr:hypothetical protein [Streptococcus sp. DD12]